MIDFKYFRNPGMNIYYQVLILKLEGQTSTNHFSVKLRPLLQLQFTLDFLTLTKNFNISYFEQKRKGI